MNTYMTFYWEWLLLDKKDFRILAMLADKGTFTGTLTDLCRYLSLSTQSKHTTQLRNSIEALTENGFISCQQNGRTYTLQAVPKGNEIILPRRWTESIIHHEYSSESVAWEQVLKVFLWIHQNRTPIIQDNMIAEDLNISTSTITCAKNVLERELHAITREIEKVQLTDGSKRNVGQRLGAIAEWSE